MSDVSKPDEKSLPKTTATAEVKTNVSAIKQHAAGPLSLATNPSPPIARIEQTERCDDAIACVAMLCRMPLERVTELAHGLGYPKVGPAYFTDDMLAALAMKAGNWVAKNYKEFVNVETLPPIAILYVDYSEAMDVGRTVLWLRPPAPADASKLPPTQAAHRASQVPLQVVGGSRVELGPGFVIDPAHWIKPEQRVLTGVSIMHFVPGWFMELTQATKPGKP